jgi:hypothetical protein
MHATTWINPEKTILGEISQPQKTIYYTILCNTIQSRKSYRETK